MLTWVAPLQPKVHLKGSQNVPNSKSLTKRHTIKLNSSALVLLKSDSICSLANPDKYKKKLTQKTKKTK